MRVGEGERDLADLVAVLGDVRLPVGAGLPGELRRPAEHVGPAREREARRERVAQAAVVAHVPARTQVGRLAEAGVEDAGRGQGVVVASAIHHHLADDRPDPVRLGGPERRVERRLEHRPVHHGGRRPGRGEGPERERRQALGGLLVERALEREDVAPEPGEEVEARADACVGQLRQVDVEVDHPGQHDQRAEIDDLAAASVGRPRADGRDPSRGVHLDPSVRLVSRPAGGERRQDACPEHERRPVGKHVCHQTGCYMRSDDANRRTMRGWTPTSTAS